MADQELKWQSILGWMGIGETSNGSQVIWLYHTNPGMRYFCSYVYEEEFEKLPQAVQDQIAAALAEQGVQDVLQPTEKEKAEKSKYFHYIEEITLPIANRRVQWGLLGQQPQPTQQQAGKPAGVVAANEPYIWQPLTEEQFKLARQLAEETSKLEWLIAGNVLDTYLEEAGIDPDDVNNAEALSNMLPDVLKSTSYSFAKLWPLVRGSVVTSGVDASGDLDALYTKIAEAEPEEFLKLLADGHPLVLDEAFAKGVMKKLGESGIKPNGGDRYKQAERAVRYVEMTMRLGINPDAALSAIQESDEIPF